MNKYKDLYLNLLTKQMDYSELISKRYIPVKSVRDGLRIVQVLNEKGGSANLIRLAEKKWYVVLEREINEVDWKKALAAGAIAATLAAGQPKAAKAEPLDPFMFFRTTPSYTQVQQTRDEIELPAWEEEIIEDVANEYGLTSAQKSMLYMLRAIENGPQGQEYNIIRSDNARYQYSKYASLEHQARLAAGFIKNQWTTDLNEFGRRWKNFKSGSQISVADWVRKAQDVSGYARTGQDIVRTVFDLLGSIRK